jgi:hypothetical protein
MSAVLEIEQAVSQLPPKELTFASGSRNLTPRCGTDNLKRTPSPGSSTHLPIELSQILARASARSYETLRESLL